MAFNFPDPAVETTVTNPLTGAIYQWKADPGKWVLAGGPSAAANPPVTIDLLPPEAHQKGDLWIHEETLIEYAWDGTQWFEVGSSCGGGTGSDAPGVINSGEAFTRHYKAEAPSIFDSTKDGTCALTSGLTIETITNIKVSANDRDGKIRYLYKVNEDILLEDPDNGAYAVLRVTNIISAGDYDVELEHYNGTTNVDLGKTYSFGSAADRGAIPDVGDDTHQPGTLDDRYVNEKGGDSMQGPLSVTGGRDPNADGIESTIEVLNVDSGQNSSLNLKHNGATQIYVGSTQTSFQGDIKFNVGGRAIYAQGPDKKGFVINNGGVFYDGAYSVDRHVATKKDVEEAIYHDILDTDTNKYVDRTGDSMSGPLVMDNTEVRFNNRSDGQTLIRAGRNEAEFPMLLDLRHPGGSVAGGYDIKIQGNTSYNQLRFVGSDTYLTMNAGGGALHRVMFNVDISLENNRIEKLGRAVNDTDAVPYGQVEEELQEFRDSLVQELTFGSWLYSSSNISPVTGRFYFRDALNANNNLAPNTVTQMVFNETDFVGAVGAFDRIDTGELISLTNGSVTVKYRVNSKASISGPTNEVRSFDVQFLSQSAPTFFIDGVPWTFTLTEFTDISVDQLDDTYLRLDCTNDPLNTELEIKTPDFGEAALTLTGKRDNVNNSTATIGFRNQTDTAEAYVGYLTYRTTGSSNGYFRFNQDVDLNNKGLHSVAQIRMQPGGYIGSAANPRLTFHNATSGNEGEGLLVVPRPASARRGFAIRGNDATSTEKDLLFSFTNATGPDAVNYVGKMDSDNNLVNLGKVKELAETVVLIGTTCNWRKDGLDDTTLDRQYFGIEKAGSTSSQVGYGNVLYLNKLIAIDGTLQPLENYTPTDGSLIEVWSGNELWFKSLLDPTTYKVASRNPDEIVCDFTTNYPIVSKGGTNWSGSTYYRIILTGMKYTG